MAVISEKRLATKDATIKVRYYSGSVNKDDCEALSKRLSAPSFDHLSNLEVKSVKTRRKIVQHHP